MRLNHVCNLLHALKLISRKIREIELSECAKIFRRFTVWKLGRLNTWSRYLMNSKILSVKSTFFQASWFHGNRFYSTFSHCNVVLFVCENVNFTEFYRKYASFEFDFTKLSWSYMYMKVCDFTKKNPNWDPFEFVLFSRKIACIMWSALQLISQKNCDIWLAPTLIPRNF